MEEQELNQLAEDALDELSPKRLEKMLEDFPRILTSCQEQALRCRFGLLDGRRHSYEEAGRKFGIPPLMLCLRERQFLRHYGLLQDHGPGLTKMLAQDEYQDS